MILLVFNRVVNELCGHLILIDSEGMLIYIAAIALEKNRNP